MAPFPTRSPAGRGGPAARKKGGPKARGGQDQASREFEEQHPRGRGGLWTKKHQKQTGPGSGWQSGKKPLSREEARRRVFKPLVEKKKAEREAAANKRKAEAKKKKADAKERRERRGGDSRTGRRRGGGGTGGTEGGGSSRTGSREGGDEVLRRGDGMRGDPDPRVEDLQTLLDELGFDLGGPGVDGRFGPLTRRALIQFQGEAGLPTTGVFGPRTRAELKRFARRIARSRVQGIIEGSHTERSSTR